MNRTLRKLKFYGKQCLLPKKAYPPYHHACQIGDPVLREVTNHVEPELIKTKEFQNLIEHLIKMMRLYDAYGLSAPQVGVPWQIFITEVTARQIRLAGPTMTKKGELEVVPLKVFINPTIKIINQEVLQNNEGCVSISCFEAEVPRYKEVLITGLNASGEKHEWKAKNWAARIAQHEMDHLEGVLFTDKMNPTTLSLIMWEEVNKTRGRVKLTFDPQ